MTTSISGVLWAQFHMHYLQNFMLCLERAGGIPNNSGSPSIGEKIIKKPSMVSAKPVCRHYEWKCVGWGVQLQGQWAQGAWPPHMDKSSSNAKEL